MAYEPEVYASDLASTLENRRRLQGNRNLLHWYRGLYERMLGDIPGLEHKRILEIGSGTSPLSTWYPQVMTSDVLRLDYLDHVFDCHELDRYDAIPDGSLDVVVMTNVLHHLRDPVLALRRIAPKLGEGGELRLLEPYFSLLSYPIYRYLHHEAVDFSVASARLASTSGPLSAANQAIPYLLFFKRRHWLEPLADCYDLSRTEFRFYTGLSYMMTGGISRTLPLPAALYRLVFGLDDWLACRLPRLFASFFIACLHVKPRP